jgi:hypothetical protein
LNINNNDLFRSSPLTFNLNNSFKSPSGSLDLFFLNHSELLQDKPWSIMSWVWLLLT